MSPGPITSKKAYCARVELAALDALPGPMRFFPALLRFLAERWTRSEPYKTLGSTPTRVKILAALRFGIPSLSAVSARDSGLNVSLTGRRMLVPLASDFTTLILAVEPTRQIGSGSVQTDPLPPN